MFEKIKQWLHELDQRFCAWYNAKVVALNQRAFADYQARLRAHAEQMCATEPLVGFPFLMFVELELPAIYAKDGPLAAMQAAQEWPNKFLANLGLEPLSTPKG